MYVYVITAPKITTKEGYIRTKIGRTKNVKKRFKDIERVSPCRLNLITFFETIHESDEKALHKIFREHLAKGVEWFDLPQDVLNFFSQVRTREDVMERYDLTPLDAPVAHSDPEYIKAMDEMFVGVKDNDFRRQ